MHLIVVWRQQRAEESNGMTGERVGESESEREKYVEAKRPQVHGAGH
jgi:hypothetical protein